MSIVLARIDSRLVHGQILEGWVPFTGSTMIIVADDRAAVNLFQQKVMKMAVPEYIKLKIESVSEAVDDITNHVYDDERVMVLFSSPHAAYEAFSKGLKCDCINLGNVNYMQGRKQVTSCVALDNDIVNDLRALMEKGVKIDVRGVPRESPLDIDEVIDNYLDLCRRNP